MNPSGFTARRATLEDLPALRQLWLAEQLAELQLDKCFTDFQVAQTAEGRIVAALGLHVDGLHGRIHGEAFLDPAQTDLLRPLLWERLQAVARNRGLVRLWTRESVPFWRECAFESAPVEVLEKIPETFGPRPSAWLTLKLKEETASALSPEQEFDLFRQTAKEETDRVLQQARFVKIVALAISLAVLAAVMIAGGLLIWKKHLRDASPPHSAYPPAR